MAYPNALKRPAPMPGTFGATPRAIPNAIGGSIPTPLVGNTSGGVSNTTPQAYTPPKTAGSIPQSFGGSPGFIGSLPKVAGMMASQAGHQTPQLANRNSVGSIPAAFSGNTAITSGSNAWKRNQSGGVIPPAPGTPASAAAWINNPKNGYGGLEKYSANNINRFKNGEISYNQLLADSQRVGYDISGLNVGDASAMPGDTTTVDYAALAREEMAPQLAEYERAVAEQIAALQGSYNQNAQHTQDDRTLQKVWFDRNNSPFTGQTDDKRDVVGRQWAIEDANLQGGLNSQIGSLQQGLTDFKTNYEGQIQARAYQLEQDALGNARADAGITGMFNGAPTLAATQWTQTFNEDKRRYGEDFAYKKARDTIADAADKRAFDEKVRQDGIDAAVSWYSAKTSRNSSNTSAAALAWSKDPNNPDNVLKNKQIGELGKPNVAKAFDDLSKVYLYTDPGTGVPKISNPAALRAAIIGMNLPDDADTDALLLKFGLQPN